MNLIFRRLLLLYILWGATSHALSIKNDLRGAYLEDALRNYELEREYQRLLKLTSRPSLKESLVAGAVVLGVLATIGYGAWQLYAWHCRSVAAERLISMVAEENDSQARAIMRMVEAGRITDLQIMFKNSKWPYVDCVNELERRKKLYAEWISWTYESGVIIDEILRQAIIRAYEYGLQYEATKEILMSDRDYINQSQLHRINELSDEVHRLRFKNIIGN